MICPRIKHFIRLQPSGKVSKCGHMIGAKEFETFDEMQKSVWLENIKNQMDQDIWPEECVRCKNTEEIYKRSIRLDMIDRDKILRAHNKDYVIVGGVLDNICNSGCQTCNAGLSSKIGSITKSYIKVDNFEKFYQLPIDRIVELDINGGEPTYSPNYKKIINNLPPNIKIVRINTNAHRTFKEIINLLEKKIRVIVTVSFDGLGNIHDYIRWPIKFTDVEKTLQEYLDIKKTYQNLLRINTWTTVSVYNINQLDEIIKYLKQRQIDHEFGILESPSLLSIKNKNALTEKAKYKYQESNDELLRNLSKKIATENNNSQRLAEYISQQDEYRSISFYDYFNFKPNLL